MHDSAAGLSVQDAENDIKICNDVTLTPDASEAV